MADLPKLFDDSADTLLELERATADKAAKPFLKPLRKVLATLTAVWPGDDADPFEKQRALTRLNILELLAPMDEAERVIMAGAIDALEHGIGLGIEQAAAAGVQVMAFKRTTPEEVGTATQHLRRGAQAQMVQARGMLREAGTLEQAMHAVVLASPQARAERTARYLTNHASNLGINAVADSDTDLVQVWVAERDACVHCLAYQGHIRLRGGYPAGLTFGKKPLKTTRVAEPPLHPNCRCTQWVLGRDTAAAVQVGLVREAKRSILRGWAVESESQSVRVDAARRLLAKHPTLPKSVQAYARKAVKTGAFARGRQFPGAR